MRFVFDNYDVGTGEVAKHIKDENKILPGELKLVHEGKVVAHSTIKSVIREEDALESAGWVVQLAGLSRQVYSVHLITTGFYQVKVRFPTSLTDLDKFVDFITALFMFTSQVEGNTKRLSWTFDFYNRIRSSLGLVIDNVNERECGNST